ncbi:HpcH/HpaI aldolase/citrate lyase family protein [Arthrobacter sp. Marseille-P9274]|uniref:HpcH/HpaI aldolase family protein n=1 Tax=Arthrobacter sp. Marseille-P9274 TaxID=2866572 RepID=UPI0021C76BA3|nr:HpcH/HpaI aldolase/citrate lyase family protein [Arthrobacter sp. Marseille-P9274]
MSLKDQLSSGEPQYGLWLGLANAYSAEISSGSGPDWVLVDGEHAPNTLTTVLGQVQAVRGLAEVVLRPPDREPTIIKQYLDLGVQNLLVPMVETPGQAAAAVAATRFPPAGTRGVSHTLNRASGFGQNADYLRTAHEPICLFMQIESAAGLDSVKEIATVTGVDGVFVGPAALAASLGHLGNPRHPEVREAVAHVLETAQSVGVYSGLNASSPADGREWAMKGASLVAIGSDVGVLQRGTHKLFQEVRTGHYPDPG